MSEDKIDRIEKIGEEEELNPAIAEETKQAIPTATPNRERFQNLMQDEQKVISTSDTKTSLMDTVRDMNYTGGPTGKVSTQSLLAQTEQVISKIDAVKQTLETPNANIKSPTHVKLLENKLSHIDESLKIALSKAGVEFQPKTGEVAPIKGINPSIPGQALNANPIARFLGYVTDGQWQLENLYSTLNAYAQEGKQLSPANMLAIQIKVGQIGQELQLFYSLLSKGLESVKTIMNIQV